MAGAVLAAPMLDASDDGERRPARFVAIAANWFDEQGRPTAKAREAILSVGLPPLLEGWPFLYPKEHLKRSRRGCVTVQFTILENGLTDQFAIVDSRPDGSFDETVLRSLRFWKFEPSGRRHYASLPLRFGFRVEPREPPEAVAPYCAVPQPRITGISVPKDRVTAGPIYTPPAMARQGTVGCATVVFRVHENGLADDFGAFDVQPDPAFFAATARSLKDWKFHGVAKGTRAVARIEFGLQDEDEPPRCKWPAVKNYKDLS